MLLILIAVVGLVVLPLLVVAAIVAVIGGLCFVAALWPPFQVWSHNRREQGVPR